MMKRNVLLLLALLVLAIIAWLILKNPGDHKSSYDRAESNFKIENPETIGRIILTHKNGVRSDLRREENHWTINQTHRARQSNIDILLSTIQKQHLQFIPNKAAEEAILNYLAVSGIHVEIFDREGKELLDYYVGGVTPTELGTYFLKAGSAQPYCLHIPGYDAGLRTRYALEPVDWRDVRFWQEDNERIDTIKGYYPKQRQHSFVISRNGQRYDIEPMFSTTPRNTGDVTNRVKSYLTNLSQIACEDYMNSAVEKDSVLQMVPFLELEFIYPDTQSMIRFFPVGQVIKSEFSPPVSRYWIDYKGRDFMIGQHEVMKGAFRSYDYFFGK